MIINYTPITTKIPAILIGGQSNADGTTEVPPPKEIFIPSKKCQIKGKKAAGDIREFTTFSKLNYYTGNALGTTNGIELYLAKNYQKPLYIVKVVRGGSALALSWAPGAGMRTATITHLQDAITQINNDNVIWFNYWNQWEDDSLNAQYSADYYNNLINYFDDLETSTGIDFIHMVSAVNTNSNYYIANPANGDLIIQAQIDAMNHYGGSIIPTQDLQFHDGKHYTQDGQRILAERVLKNMELYL